MHWVGLLCKSFKAMILIAPFTASSGVPHLSTGKQAALISPKDIHGPPIRGRHLPRYVYSKRVGRFCQQPVRCPHRLLGPIADFRPPFLRGIGLDERVYRDARLFRPERFLPKSEGGDGEPPFVGVFGYGRRICPGQWLADNALWLLVASMLSVFDMVKATDAEGKEIELTMEFLEGFGQ